MGTWNRFVHSAWRQRHVLIRVLLALLVLNAGRLAFAKYWPQYSASATPVVSPYTVVLRAIRHNPNGTELVRWTETFAVTSTGASMWRWEGEQGGAAYVNREIYLPSGERISVDDVGEMKTTYTWRDYRSRLQDPRYDCLKSMDGADVRGEQLGRGRIGEWDVVRIRTSVSVDAFAPAAGCAPVGGTGNPGPAGYMEKRLVSLRQKEPAPELFLVPDRYREVNQSALGGIRSRQ